MSIAYWVNRATGEGLDAPWPLPAHWSDTHDWIWRIDVLARRLASSAGGTVFACGDSRNKAEAYRLFDRVFMLHTGDDVLRRRIQGRTGNDFGKSDSEFAWVVRQNRMIREEARQARATISDASRPLTDVVNDILRILGLAGSGS